MPEEGELQPARPRAAAAQRAAMEILEAFFICDDGAPSPDTVGFGAPLSYMYAVSRMAVRPTGLPSLRFPSFVR